MDATPGPASPGAPAPLTAEQRAALDEARGRLKPLLRPARVANVNAWTVGVFGALSLVAGLVAGGGGVIVGAALLAVAWNEARGRDRLRALDPEGATILGWNQLALGAVVTLYCLATILRARTSPDASTRQIEELAGLEPGMMAELTAYAYGAVIVAVDLVQALLARWHFSKKEAFEAFRRETPPWVVDVLAGGERGG